MVKVGDVVLYKQDDGQVPVFDNVAIHPAVVTRTGFSNEQSKYIVDLTVFFHKQCPYPVMDVPKGSPDHDGACWYIREPK